MGQSSVPRLLGAYTVFTPGACRWEEEAPGKRHILLLSLFMCVFLRVNSNFCSGLKQLYPSALLSHLQENISSKYLLKIGYMLGTMLNSLSVLGLSVCDSLFISVDPGI